MSAHYRLTDRSYHSIEAVGEEIYLWGGSQYGLPGVHDNERKRLITTKVDLFNLRTMEWKKVLTSGTPPAGAMNYSTTTVGGNILFFGGRCNSHECYHNDLHLLNTETKAWRAIPCSGGPMEKYACGMISYSFQGSDYLLTLGGVGKLRQHPQSHSQYTPCGNDYCTNEVHTMNITLSPGKWRVLDIRGQPPPLAHFTLNMVQKEGTKAILFGGWIAQEQNKGHKSSDVYLISVSTGGMDCSRLQPTLTFEWPKPRSCHASTIITCATDGQESHLLVMGGQDDAGYTIADCCVMNITMKKWNKIDLPQSVCGRYDHSLSSFRLNRNTNLVIVTGGFGMGSADVTVIVEIEYLNSLWVVRRICNCTHKEELVEKIKAMKLEELPYKTVREDSKKQVSTLDQECGRLTELLKDAQHEIKQTREAIQRKDTIIGQKNSIIHQNQFDLQELTDIIHQKDIELQQAAFDLHVKANQIQALQNETTTMNYSIREKDATIAEQHFMIANFEETPHWVICSEEVEMTETVLGEGAWGEVKVGIFRGSRVAVKSTHQLIRSEHNSRLFCREIDIASRVRHPNLLQFIGAIVVGTPAIVTEVMPTSLRKELTKSPMTRPQVIAIGGDVASGLNYLHMWKPEPIIHRDVSSANVLLEPSGRGQWKAKLSDYGSANLVDKILSSIVPGALVYSAPESQYPKQHSPAMDIYSLGILLVEMATGQFPSSVHSERQEQVKNVRWVSIKGLILQCICDEPGPRLTANTLLTELKKI